MVLFRISKLCLLRSANRLDKEVATYQQVEAFLSSRAQRRGWLVTHSAGALGTATGAASAAFNLGVVQ
jgi:hypothetical protein